MPRGRSRKTEWEGKSDSHRAQAHKLRRVGRWCGSRPASASRPPPRPSSFEPRLLLITITHEPIHYSAGLVGVGPSFGS
eukprot:scaffold5520_cov102-Isochrysis_galbana.AAC.7